MIGANHLSAPKSRIAVRWRFLPQTRVSQGTPERGPFLPIFFAEEIAVRRRFSSQRKSRILGPQQIKSRDFLGSGKNRRRSRRESRDFGALSKPPAEASGTPQNKQHPKKRGDPSVVVDLLPSV